MTSVDTLKIAVSLSLGLIYLFLVQMYVPPPCMFNKDYLRSLLDDEKKMLSMNDKRTPNVPKYDELSVKNIYPSIQTDPELMMYFPDKMAQNRLPDREYMFTILNTLKPDYVKKIILHASKMRNSAEGKGGEAEQISITDTWWKKLHEIPFVSCKYIPFTNSIQLAREEL